MLGFAANIPDKTPVHVAYAAQGLAVLLSFLTTLDFNLSSATVKPILVLAMAEPQCFLHLTFQT